MKRSKGKIKYHAGTESKLRNSRLHKEDKMGKKEEVKEVKEHPKKEVKIDKDNMITQENLIKE